MATDLKLLTESIDYSRANVDADKHVITSVAVLQPESRNNRLYSDDVILKAARVFEEVPVTVRGAHDRQRRDYNSQNGVLRNGRHDAERNLAVYDWHLNEADPLTPKILVDAKKFPGNIPLSVEIGDWTQEEAEGDGPVRITDITEDQRLLGVAAVYRGGTNKTIFEGDENVSQIKTLEELRTAYPALCTELLEADRVPLKKQLDEGKDKLTELLAERDGLNAKVKELQDKLAVFEDEKEATRRREEVLQYVSEQLGEEYRVGDDELGNYLYLYEDDRYKKTVDLIKQRLPQKKDGKTPPADDGVGARGDLGGKGQVDHYEDLLEYEVR